MKMRVQLAEQQHAQLEQQQKDHQHQLQLQLSAQRQPSFDWREQMAESKKAIKDIQVTSPVPVLCTVLPSRLPSSGGTLLGPRMRSFALLATCVLCCIFRGLPPHHSIVFPALLSPAPARHARAGVRYFLA